MHKQGENVAQSNTHTPTPWHTRGGSIDGANYANVFTSTTFSQISKDDAAYIVRCVNAHEALVSALAWAMRYVMPVSGESREEFTAQYKAARRALALAEAHA